MLSSLQSSVPSLHEEIARAALVPPWECAWFLRDVGRFSDYGRGWGCSVKGMEGAEMRERGRVHVGWMDIWVLEK